jgi:hypothetical protein
MLLQQVSKMNKTQKQLNVLFERYGFEFNHEDKQGSFDELDALYDSEENKLSDDGNLYEEFSVITLEAIIEDLKKALA